MAICSSIYEFGIRTGDTLVQFVRGCQSRPRVAAYLPRALRGRPALLGITEARMMMDSTSSERERNLLFHGGQRFVPPGGGKGKWEMGNGKWE